MGMRKYRRAIAKARMADMGIDRINRKMGLQISSANLKEAWRCMGKKKRAELWRELQTRPLWRRVLTGDLAKTYWKEKRRREIADARKGRTKREER